MKDFIGEKVWLAMAKKAENPMKNKGIRLQNGKAKALNAPQRIADIAGYFIIENPARELISLGTTKSIKYVQSVYYYFFGEKSKLHIYENMECLVSKSTILIQYVITVGRNNGDISDF